MLFTFVLYAPKAYIRMIIRSLDENIVHETLVKKSELFRDSTVETNPGTENTYISVEHCNVNFSPKR